jgi:hypothetical protein
MFFYGLIIAITLSFIKFNKEKIPDISWIFNKYFMFVVLIYSLVIYFKTAKGNIFDIDSLSQHNFGYPSLLICGLTFNTILFFFIIRKINGRV